MKPLSKLNFSILVLLIANNSFSQLVTIEGKQFKLNGANFYPTVLNYSVEISSPSPGTSTWQTNGYITSFVDYNDNSCGTGGGCFECNNGVTCTTQLQDEFNYMAGMGFNTLRIAGFYPRFQSGQLVWQGRDNPDRNWFYIPIDPNNSSDPGLQFVFSMYEDMLAVANNTINSVTMQPQPMKIILLMIGSSSYFTPTEVNAYNDFLRALATYINTSPNKSAVLAYDLWNEPCWEDWSYKSKEEACEVIKTWYNTAKTFDPDHLITLGSCGTSDASEYDPSIIKVDFISVHFYPGWLPFEDRNLPYYQQLAQKRVYNEIYWINKSSPYPWIVGETGFTASNFHTIAQGLNGTVSDQQNYAQQTLDATCNCGGSGYSWWAYQDGYWADPNCPGCEFYGLLERGYAPSSTAEKDAVTNFRNYSPVITGPCPVDYSATYDETKVFYDPYKSSDYNISQANAVSGTIQDLNGNPIKNAFIIALNWLETIDNTPLDPLDFDFTYHHNWLNTYSDENGFFKAIPYNYTTVGDNRIVTLRANAAGAERVEAGGWWPFDDVQMTQNLNTINIKKVNFEYDGIINNEVVASGNTKNFKGFNSLTIKNSIINGISDITARNEININTEFHASSSSEVHAYLSEPFPDCADLNGFMRTVNSTTGNGSDITKDEKRVELTFADNKQTVISINPNPNNGIFTIELTNRQSEDNFNINIKNPLGESLKKLILSSNKLNIDLSSLPKGVYLIEFNSRASLQTKKIIIN